MGTKPDDSEADLASAGRAVADRLGTIREMRWVPFVAAAAIVALGVFIRRRPLREVAGTGARAVRTGLEVAGAIAAVRRFRETREPAQRKAA